MFLKIVAKKNDRTYFKKKYIELLQSIMKRSYSVDEGDEYKNEDNSPKFKGRYNYVEEDGELSKDFDHLEEKQISAKDKEYVEIKDKKVVDGEAEKMDKENRLEQMEFENYSLRKRCKRLESIVTQLLRTKHKSENGHEPFERNELSDNNITSDNKEYGIIVKRPYETTHLSRTPTPPAYNPPLYNDSRELSSPTIHSKCVHYDPAIIQMDTDYIRKNRTFIKVGTSSQEMKADVPLKQNKDHFQLHSMVHVPSPYKTGDYANRQASTEIRQKYDVKVGGRTDREQSSRKGDESPNLKEELSPEEMEQRNEMFRSTYYCNHDLKKKIIKEKNTYEVPRLKRSSPPYHSHDLVCTDRYRRTHSPDFLLSSFYEKHYIRDSIKSDLDNLEQNRSYRPELLRMTNQRESNHDERRLYYEFVSDKKSLLDRSLGEFKYERLLPPQSKTQQLRTVIELTGRTPETYIPSVSGHHRSRSQAVTSDVELGKYNSDFYTKLPPKLHIVESQNENGVTLTWNATSNCDSSLVKSYQLFARELFGHKVGTMKRIGVVDALPLPMSCNIDKLKYNIKYKFAVCAVDIYSRFGKMSNFTGKFELKPKGPIQENEERELELEIVV